MYKDKPLHDQDFWQFSVAFYGYKNNQQLLLMLQDSAVANVNLVLFVIYSTVIDLPVNINEIKQLKLAIANIDRQTQLLRVKRRQVKKDLAVNSLSSSDTYQNLLKQELEMEKQQQVVLVNTYNQIVADRGGAGLSKNDVNEASSGLSKLVEQCCVTSTENDVIIESLMTNVESYLLEISSDYRAK